MLASLLVLWMAAPVTVYVGPEVKADGFVDAGTDVADSVKDIREELGRRLPTKGKKAGYRLIDDQREAQVKIYVTERGTGIGSAGGGSISAVRIGSGVYGTVSGSSAEYKILNASLLTGDKKKDFTGTSVYTWHGAAGDLAEDITAWLKINRDRIVAEK